MTGKVDKFASKFNFIKKKLYLEKLLIKYIGIYVGQMRYYVEQAFVSPFFKFSIWVCGREEKGKEQEMEQAPLGAEALWP